MADHSSGSGFFSNHYVKIYFTLLGLLTVSIIGPTFEILFVTLVTAFGIAVVKAWLVIKHFMHLTIERVMPKLFLAASVVLLALFWGGVAPDVQQHSGRMWENQAAQAAVDRGISEPEVHAEEEHAEEGEHAEVSYAGLVPTAKTTENILPGGYNFVHGAFWTVVVLVGIGTNAVAIILSIGLLLLALETLMKIPILQRIVGPMLEKLMRLPGVGRIRKLLPGGQEA